MGNICKPSKDAREKINSCAIAGGNVLTFLSFYLLMCYVLASHNKQWYRSFACVASLSNARKPPNPGGFTSELIISWCNYYIQNRVSSAHFSISSIFNMSKVTGSISGWTSGFPTLLTFVFSIILISHCVVFNSE